MAVYHGFIQLRQHTSSEWAANDVVLLPGQMGAVNVGSSTPTLKIGDGVRPFSQLPNLLAPVDAANDYIAGTTTTLPAGSAATVTIDNTVDPPLMHFGIPAGNTGPANSLTIGTVTNGAPGEDAAASITGTPPNQVLHLTIPQGEPSTVPGPIGPVGPPNSLAIGTVTTGAAGAPAEASITGTPPEQVLHLSIPTGAQGPQGIQGPQGVPGSAAFADPSVSIALTMKPGSSAFAMRADAAPALDQGIAPTWTANHIFASGSSFGVNGCTINLTSSSPAIMFDETDGAAANRRWGIYAASERFSMAAFADASGAGSDWLSVDRTGTVVDSIALAASVTTISNDLRSKGMGRFAGWYGVQAADFNGPAMELGYSAGIAYVHGYNRTTLAYIPVEIDASTITLSPNGVVRMILNPAGGGAAMINFYGTTNASHFYYGADEHTYIRSGKATGNVYIGDAGTTNAIMCGVSVRTPYGLTDIAAGKQLQWNLGTFTYGTVSAYGAISGYTGFINQDGGPVITMMSSAVGGGIYSQGDSKWLIYRSSGTVAYSSYTFEAPAFNVSSARALKRETGKPARAADILAKLRPILYRLLADGEEAREQLGLIAEEVHEVCPQLSDGKTVSYDRLALLLLADWQAARELVRH